MNFVFPDINTILNLLNITITAFIWVGYKIARIKQAVDLRILMVDITIRFFGTLIILTLSWALYLLPEVNGSIIGIIQPILYLFGLVLFAGFGDAYAEKRVERLYENRGLTNSPNKLVSMKGREAIYLVCLMEIDIFVPSMCILFVFTMGLLQWPPNPGALIPLLVLSLIFYALRREYKKMKRIQRDIFEEGE